MTERSHRNNIRRYLIWLTTGAILSVSGLIVSTNSVHADPHLDKLAKLGTLLEEKLNSNQEQALSAGGLNLVTVSKHFSRFDFRALEAQQRELAVNQSPARRSPAPGEVNDPYAAEDFASRLLGMTQSETSAARCGRNVAIGFNDSGSFAATAFLGVNPSGGLSFQGWARSTDSGQSYVDQGAMFVADPPAGVTTRDLFGDPVLGCTSPQTFYYASLATDILDNEDQVSAIGVSRSTDAANTFPRTVLAAGKSGSEHFLDKPWMAVEPGPTAAPSDDVIHVSYTDFDFSAASAGCGEAARTAIEYVRSTDGGATWSAPLTISEVCGDAPVVQGSQVEVGLNDDVYVAWQQWAGFPTGTDVRIRRSTNLGSSFGPARVVDTVTPTGDGFSVQGNFRTFLALQGLAVDTSRTASRGNVYVTWHDGRFRSQPDPVGGCDGPRYCFGDALLARSTNNGNNWGTAVRVNDDDIRRGIDQIFPALDVDSSGTVWVGFYDRRWDDRNFLLDFVVARSTNRGSTFSNTRVTRNSFAPVTGWQDLVVNPAYMGDYLAVASDRLGAPGVITAWGDNSRGDANVLHRRF